MCGYSFIVLEHHGNVTFLRAHAQQASVVDQDVTLVDGLRACEHSQAGRLAAPGGTHHDDHFTVDISRSSPLTALIAFE